MKLTDESKLYNLTDQLNYCHTGIRVFSLSKNKGKYSLHSGNADVSLPVSEWEMYLILNSLLRMEKLK